jgi:hypothetical protein
MVVRATFRTRCGCERVMLLDRLYPEFLLPLHGPPLLRQDDPTTTKTVPTRTFRLMRFAVGEAPEIRHAEYLELA